MERPFCLSVGNIDNSCSRRQGQGRVSVRGKKIRLRVFATRCVRMMHKRLPQKGCRKSRVPAAPIAPCAKGSKHTVVDHRSTGTPGFPRAMVLTVSFALSSVTGLFVTVALREASFPKNLTPAPGRQDHTTSPSALHAVRQKRVGVHRIPSRVRDDRDTPLQGM
jgi:hypothetical protein